MAAAWRYVAGLDDNVPIIDVDTWKGDLPRRCLGYTKRIPARGRHIILLGEGVSWNVSEGEPRADVLPAELLQQFGVTMYMPPIHGNREIDILAYLDYANRVRFPRSGFRYRAIDAPLICRLFFDTDWPNNFRGLANYLKLVADDDREKIGGGDPRSDGEADGSGSVEILPVLREWEKLKWFRARIDWRCDANKVPFGLLPDLATRIYAWHSTLVHLATDGEGVDDPSLRLTLLPKDGWRRRGGLRVQQFLAMSTVSYVQQILLWGLHPTSQAQISWAQILRDRVTRNPVFGATFESLQSGLAMDVRSIAKTLKEITSSGSDSTAVAARHPGVAPGMGTEAERSASDERPRGRFFCDGENFVIEFTVGESKEFNHFPIKDHLGLY
jgi:hypothetical protein